MRVQEEMEIVLEIVERREVHSGNVCIPDTIKIQILLRYEFDLKI